MWKYLNKKLVKTTELKCKVCNNLLLIEFGDSESDWDFPTIICPIHQDLKANNTTENINKILRLV